MLDVNRPLSVLRFAPFFTTSPADLTDYYLAFNGLSTTELFARIFPGFQGWVRALAIETWATSTVGSAEDATLYLRLNNTTDTLVSSTVKFNAFRTLYQFSSLSFQFGPTDYFGLKFSMPDWATNPTGVLVTAHITMDSA